MTEAEVFGMPNLVDDHPRRLWLAPKRVEAQLRTNGRVHACVSLVNSGHRSWS